MQLYGWGVHIDAVFCILFVADASFSMTTADTILSDELTEFMNVLECRARECTIREVYVRCKTDTEDAMAIVERVIHEYPLCAGYFGITVRQRVGMRAMIKISDGVISETVRSLECLIESELYLRERVGLRAARDVVAAMLPQPIAEAVAECLLA
jgi:hypothetical protein